MSSVSAAKSMTNALSAAIVASDKLPRTKVWGETDSAVSWQGAFAVYGGNGTTASSAIVYEVEPAKRLGWHTDATEETQYIIAEVASSISKTEPRTKSAPAACSCCRRRCARSREYRQGNVARGRVLRRGDVHARL